MLYELIIEEGGQFESAFRVFALGDPDKGAKLAIRLEEFALDPVDSGKAIRCGKGRSAHAVPSFEDIKKGEAGAITLVDEEGLTVEACRFISPGPLHDLNGLLEWIDQLLGI